MASQDRVPSVAVVGTGHWGQNLVRNFAGLGALVAVSDSDLVTAGRFSDQYGIPAVPFEDLLQRSDLDGMVIAAPAAMHFDLARRTLEAGKHAFVEKPLALDLGEAEKLCELADAGRRVLMVGHLLQYHPVFLRLKEIVVGGDLGRVQYLYSNRLNLGRIRREEDILWSFAPHDISMILGLVGAEPDHVWAVGSKYLHQSIADVTTTHLSFPAGERAHIFVSWLHPSKEQRLVVVGDRGMAVFDDGEPWESKLMQYRHRIEWRDGRPEPVRAKGEAVGVVPSEPLEVECRHFLECIETGRPPRTDGREGLRVLRVLHAAEQAMLAEAPPPPTPPSSRSAPSFLDVFVHESSYVDSGCEIGEGTKVWHFAHVLSGSRIGRDCTLGQNVTVGPDVTVGDNCKIQNNVSVYKGVTLEDGVFCGPGCVFTNVNNPRAAVDRRDEFLPTVVEQGATIGANATIICGNRIGANAFIGAGAVVTSDVPAHALMVGSPARRVGWMSHAGERLGADLVCPRTGRAYRETATGTLEEIVR